MSHGTDEWEKGKQKEIPTSQDRIVPVQQSYFKILLQKHLYIGHYSNILFCIIEMMVK